MAGQAPQPGQTGVTYLDVRAITIELRDMKPTSSESHSYGLWDGILNWTFPISEDYITRPNTSMPSASGEYSGSIWDEGAEQLRKYLRAQHGCRPVNKRTPVYGILAVGRRVRFFLYDDVTKDIQGWQPDTTFEESHGGQQFYHVKHDAT
ncbi:hypothetical protein AJ80_08025 [Polytolypa hystricis UAMH7299]|uniref:Uncharacterized protein n=1 Tax=Polytolypa hystricis (strain UAMH7299) TaxID=1447883 RepID=A0A2B7XE95_POLH7|nr:hypothetical protein AJ80_08025 [Polytolypa hystricis UAMH7299]